MEVTIKGKKMSAFKLRLVQEVNGDGKTSVLGYVHLRTVEFIDGGDEKEKEYVNIVAITAPEALEIVDYRRKVSFKDQTMKIIPKDINGLEPMLFKILLEAYKVGEIAYDDYIAYVGERLRQYAIRFSSDRRLASEFFNMYIRDLAGVTYTTFSQLMRENGDEVNEGLTPRTVESSGTDKVDSESDKSYVEVYNIEQQLQKAFELALKGELKCQTEGSAEEGTDEPVAAEDASMAEGDAE